jgi:AcrR family transcriptional regulator
MSAKPRIERAALEVFVREGVDAATTRAIAAQAGVSEGALYRHFRSKDELATSLFMTTHRRLSGLIQESADQAIGIENKAAAKAPSARTVERKKKMRILNRLMFKLNTAMVGIDSVTKEAGEFMDPRFLEFVEEHKARLVYLRNQLKETQTNLRTPAHHQDKE